MQVRDPLTGMSIYSYNQKQHTVTSGVGQGVIEKVTAPPSGPMPVATANIRVRVNSGVGQSVFENPHPYM